MNRAAKILVLLVVVLLAAGCGDDGNGSNNGGANNGGADAGNNGTGDTGGNNGSGNNGQGFTATGDTCEGTEFTACGGALTGTWALTSGCVTPTALPMYSECADVDIAVTTSASGEWTVADDGTYTVNNTFFDAELDATVPKSCLDEGETCTDNAIDDEGTDDGDACVLNYGHDVLLSSDGEYTVDDAANTVELTNEGRAFEYCVDGDTLTLRKVTDTHEALLVFTKQ